MDIHIHAPNHENQQSLEAFYEEKLQKRFKRYEFVKWLEVTVKKDEQDIYEVSLLAQTERGPKMFSKASDKVENRAANESLAQITRQLKKYKDQHYQSMHHGMGVDELPLEDD